MRGKELFPTADFAAANEGTESLAINNTFSRRWLTILALKTLGKLHKSDGLCTPVSKHAIIKKGHRLHLTEAVTMKFVAEKTSIPFPKVHCDFVHKGHAYILMERIHGDKVPGTWRSLPESGRQKVFAQLRTMIRILSRSLFAARKLLVLSIVSSLDGCRTIGSTRRRGMAMSRRLTAGTRCIDSWIHLRLMFSIWRMHEICGGESFD